MNKSLLLLSSLLLSSTAAMAVGRDTNVYAPAEGLTCQNLWVCDLFHDFNGWKSFDFVSTNKARTATIYGDKVLVAVSRNLPDPSNPDQMVDQAHINIFELTTGEFVKEVQLTYQNHAITGLLCANQIGVDDFGHVWMCGLCSDASKYPIQLYHITDINTGVCELAGSLGISEDEAAQAGRQDYYDLVGDVTGQQAQCVIMSALACPVDDSTGTKAWDKYVMGWKLEQGATEWTKHMSDGEYYCGQMEESFPEGALNWNGAPVVHIVRDEDYSGEYFYVDPFNGYPTLYTQSGIKIDDMSACPDIYNKETGIQQNINGVLEFSVAGVDLLAMGHSDYNNTPGCRFMIARLGVDKAFEGMTALWTLPQDAFGQASDGGSRVLPIKAQPVTDANGKEGAYVFAYKSQNGMGVWLVAEDGFEAGIANIEADQNGEVEYFNLQGQRVAADNLQAGIYVVRQGNTVTKTIVK